ncbi:unnamed protein product [Prunus armeniaca]|uniref:Uncharacterized protein n=1 Tax=Prunus armeniaca TaxID=36596 RepID=A0A6J5TFM3_PRUAR|nr:unnamed protein product [Prunus armeniaca]
MALTKATYELMTGAEKLSSLLDDTANWDSRMQMQSSPERPPTLLLVSWVGRCVGPELPKLAFQGQVTKLTHTTWILRLEPRTLSEGAIAPNH